MTLDAADLTLSQEGHHRMLKWQNRLTACLFRKKLTKKTFGTKIKYQLDIKNKTHFQKLTEAEN